MARLLYAASPADYFINTDGTPNPSATAQAYTTRTGSTQVVDMLDASGSATTVVSADNLGGFRFSGPDGYTGSVWVQGAGGTRYEVKPTGLAERVAALETALAQAVTDLTAAVAAAQAAAQNFASDAVGDHEDALDPHPYYVQMLDANDVPITAFRLKLISAGGSFPTTVQANRILFYGGS